MKKEMKCAYKDISCHNILYEKEHRSSTALITCVYLVSYASLQFPVFVSNGAVKEAFG